MPAIDPDDVEALGQFPARLANLAAAFPRELWATRPPIPGAFSLVEHVFHFVDFEAETARRIARVRDEDAPFLTDFDGDKVARERRYRELDLAEGLELFGAGRRATLALVATVRPTVWDRTAIQEVVGSITLASLPRSLRLHDEAHELRIIDLRGMIVPPVR